MSRKLLREAAIISLDDRLGVALVDDNTTTVIGKNLSVDGANVIDVSGHYSGLDQWVYASASYEFVRRGCKPDCARTWSPV